MSTPGSSRLAMRLARRDLRRHPWRTALVVGMVLVPTVAMTLGVIAVRTNSWSPVDQLEATWGQIDATGEWYDQGNPAPPTSQRVDELATELPAGSRVVVERHLQDRIRSDSNRVYFTLADLPLDDPLAEGRPADLEGRLPGTADEVVITTNMADRLGVALGDSVHLDRLGRDLEIVGLTMMADGNMDQAYVGAPLTEDDLPTGNAGFLETAVLVDLPGRPFLDPTGDVWSSPLVTGSPAPGWRLQPFTPNVDTGSIQLGLFWTYVLGGVALVILGTVITASFAISARRQLRTVGLLSSTGAPPRTIRRLLIAQGALTGAIGAVVGVAIGVAIALRIPAERITDIVGHPVDRIELPALGLVPILLLGPLVAGGAAAIPARSAAQVSTLQALAGRRPLASVPRRVPLWGVVSLATGAAFFAMAVAGSRDGGSSLWALVAVAGTLATLAGVCLIAPAVVAQLDGLGTRWPHSWRLAGRSLSRNRVRSSAVIGAIAAVAAALVTGSTLYASDQSSRCCEEELPQVAASQVVITAQQVSYEEPLVDDGGRPPTEGPAGQGVPAVPDVKRVPVSEYHTTPVPDDVVAAVAEILPDADQIELAGLGSTDGSMPAGTAMGGRFRPGEGADDALLAEEPWRAEARVGVATLALLNEFGIPDDLRRAIDDGQAVAVIPPPFDSTAIELDGPERTDTIEIAGSVDSPKASWSLPTVLISEATARDHGLEIAPGGLLFANDRNLDSDQRQALRTLQDDMWWEQATATDPYGNPIEGASINEVMISSPSDPEVSPLLVRAIVLGLVLVLMLAVVGVGLALAAKDDEDERQVLAAIGAPPRILRRVGALRAVLLVVVAAVLAIPAGLLPAGAIFQASGSSDNGDHFALDWPTIAFLVLVVPLATGLIVWVASRARDLIRPARPDTFLFGD